MRWRDATFRRNIAPLLPGVGRPPPHIMAELEADIPNYTDQAPVIQISEVVLGV